MREQTKDKEKQWKKEKAETHESGRVKAEQGVEERKARVSYAHCSVDDKGAGGMDGMDRVVIGLYTYLRPIRCGHPKKVSVCQGINKKSRGSNMQKNKTQSQVKKNMATHYYTNQLEHERR